MAKKFDSRKARYALSPRPIGEGGQAQVFEARDRSTNTFIALKRLRSSRDAEAIARMRREIDVQSTINHLHVMPVLDYSSQYQWYTMPLAEQSLGKLLVPIDTDELLIEIIESCVKGLAEAHTNGYIHRDLTPNNILQIRDQDGLRWVVSDWGLVRRHGRTTIARTLPGQPFGTLGFAAPEMWEDAHAVDARADVYSLGRVIAYCLTGKWPTPNIPLPMPDSKWAELVHLMTKDVYYRTQSMEEVLYQIERMKNSKYTENLSGTTIHDNVMPVWEPPRQEENFDQEIEIKKEPLYSPIKAKFIIGQRTKETITALKEKDLHKLAGLAHPRKGIRFSPYPWVSEGNLVLLPSEILTTWNDESNRLWGYYDGSGFPMELTFQDYYDQFVYSQDFINAERTNYNEFSAIGNTANNALEFYEDSIVVEYYFIGFDPQYEGMDWEGLQLAFQEDENTWYLVGIIHENWTI